MHARVNTIVGSPDQAEVGISDFKENVAPWIKQNGGSGGILLIDRETGKALGITLWPDEEAMRQSEDSATSIARGSPMRCRAGQPRRSSASKWRYSTSRLIEGSPARYRAPPHPAHRGRGPSRPRALLRRPAKRRARSRFASCVRSSTSKVDESLRALGVAPIGSSSITIHPCPL